MSEKKKLLFAIDGFEVYDNTIYTTKDKADYDAPSGFQERGVTRLPSDGVGDMFTCRFASVSPGSSAGLWDTGFYESSRCYASENDPTVVKSRLKSAVDNVMKPYAAMLGGSDVLSQAAENEYWRDKLFKVYTGQVFNTQKIEDRVELYFALMTGHLTPEGQEGDHKYSKSTYVVIDINKGMKRKDEKAAMEFEAIESFMKLLTVDKTRVRAVLDYIGLTTSDSVSKPTMMSMFKDLIEQDESKLKLYNSLIRESETEEGRAKLEVYRVLKQKYPQGGVTKSLNGVYFYQGEEIGGDLKTAASNIATQKHFEEIKKELILSEDED